MDKVYLQTYSLGQTFRDDFKGSMEKLKALGYDGVEFAGYYGDMTATELKAYLDDISEYDRGQIRVLKNSIYARHGRIFKDPALREYFEQQSWYQGTRKEIPAKEFNKYENANIAFLLKYE